MKHYLLSVITPTGGEPPVEEMARIGRNLETEPGRAGPPRPAPARTDPRRSAHRPAPAPRARPGSARRAHRGGPGPGPARPHRARARRCRRVPSSDRVPTPRPPRAATAGRVSPAIVHRKTGPPSRARPTGRSIGPAPTRAASATACAADRGWLRQAGRTGGWDRCRVDAALRAEHSRRPREARDPPPSGTCHDTVKSVARAPRPAASPACPATTTVARSRQRATAAAAARVRRCARGRCGSPTHAHCPARWRW